MIFVTCQKCQKLQRSQGSAPILDLSFISVACRIGEKLLLLQMLLLLRCFRAGVGGGGGWERPVSNHMLETEL